MLIVFLLSQVESVDDDNLDQDGSGRWPFYQFVEQLIHDMFDPSKHLVCFHQLGSYVFPLCKSVVHCYIFLFFDLICFSLGGAPW